MNDNIGILRARIKAKEKEIRKELDSKPEQPSIQPTPTEDSSSGREK